MRVPAAWEIEDVERLRRVRESEEREYLRIPLVERIYPVPVAEVPAAHEKHVVIITL